MSVDLPKQKRQVVGGFPLSEFTKTESSNITSVFHDGKSCLYIQFHNGKVYKYSVSSTGYKQLLEAQSIGKFFFQYIKDKCSFEEVDITLE